MIFYDHTALLRYDSNSGVQRVVKQLGYILEAEIPGHFAPVVFGGDGFHHCPIGSAVRYSSRMHPFRKFVRELDLVPVKAVKRLFNRNRLLRQMKTRLWEFLEAPKVIGPLANMKKGDWYLTADAIWERPQILAKLPTLRSAGVRTAVVHYDLIPLTHPQWCDPEGSKAFLPYAKKLASFDVVFCISDLVKDEFFRFCRESGYLVPKTVVTIPLGYEFTNRYTPSQETIEIPEGPFVLCVGTLDPRKNHQKLLDAFEILWGKGLELSLVIVGKPGYASEEILLRIRNHPRNGRRLIYLPNCGDAELEQLYHRCAFTVIASFFEGFGLPLVESLARGKPCVCSDISVFRHSAGRLGVYFKPEDSRSMAVQVEGLLLHPERLEFLTDSIRSEYAPPTWKDSGRVVLDTLGYRKPLTEA